ncbi:methionine--tRNA ligase [Vulgatibacter incomptus]|uniref:Methionine--tRNA ligase n=1 Tax=Vulgatibacter incomptus TaxID=1391653 RepID=A0A0K1PAB8_9BACT|nr:methionine--tRNA ligase [Vulgatibacter incomptus]AKU90447.1 Methionyl-tRNA synthetase [Vulgatibacter incomptus]
MPEKILVTAALPYANGPSHLGHLLEYIQTDVWVRFLKLTGRDAVFVWASDTHGAPIELNAAKHGVPPDEFAASWGEKQLRDFRDFLIEPDVFSSTNSPENRKWAEEIFRRLQAGGHVEERPLEQWFCEVDQRFLPDRFVKGTCPSCGAADQYGDVCEVCNKAYASTELEAPYCAICRNPPVRRTSQHFFFKLAHFQAFLEDFVSKQGTLEPQVRNSIRAWLEGGLQDWCVSRDGPYFGFEIPGAPGKYFYVWLDAPIGYLSSTERLVGEERALADYWAKDADSRIVHFIGKDIVYFHALFWPAMLHGAGLRPPSRIQVHGMITLGGEKLSKSRGRMVTAREYLDAGLDPESLRWFYASNLGAAPYDVPLAKEEIKNRVNAELVKTLANFVSRALSPLTKDFGSKLAAPSDDPESTALWAKVLEHSAKIHASYEAFELRDATQGLVQIGFEANRYLQERAPWSKRKAGDEEGAHRDLALCANVAYAIGCWIAPILPRAAQKLSEMLGGVAFDPSRLVAGAGFPLAPGLQLGKAVHLAAPIDDEKLDALWPDEAPAAAVLEKDKQKPSPAPGVEKAAPAKAPPAKAEVPIGIIDFEDFAKVELRVGKVLAAERIPKADKLLKLTVDLAEEAPRTIAAGIAEYYDPEALPGKHVVVVANLAPRTIRGIESRGMLLAGGGDQGKVVLAEVPGVPPGSRVK